jgi:Tol biopolymer transport system component
MFKYLTIFLVPLVAVILLSCKSEIANSPTYTPPPLPYVPPPVPIVRLAFVSDSTGQKQIYTSRTDSTTVRRLTISNYDDSNPKWSPDGNKIVFTRMHGSVPEIYIINSDGTNELFLSDSSMYPNWFPDGNRIIYTKLLPPDLSNTDGRMYSMRPDGSQKKAITTALTIGHSFTGWISPQGELYPSISPLGTQIVFSFFMAGWRYGTGNIYICDTSGKHAVDLTNLIENPSDIFYRLCWAPDNSKIAYCKQLWQTGIDEIFVMSADGTHKINLTNDTGSNNSNPSWVPGGEYLAIDSDRSGKSQIYLMSIDGKFVTRILYSDYDNTEPDAI